MPSNFFQLKRVSLRRGLTLLELITAVALFAVITLAVTKVFLSVSDVQRKIYQDQNLEGDLRYAMNVLFEEAKEAKMFSTDRCGATGCVGCNNKYFCTPAGDNTTLCMQNQHGDCISYFLENGQLVVQRDTQKYTLTSNEVTMESLKFNTAILEAFQSQNGRTVEIFAKIKNKESDGASLLYQTAITKTP
jgi:prepilin-type N-terminal cleavage/methylation domain-containing protein